MWAGIAQGLGSLAGGILNYFGTQQTNDQNAADTAASNATAAADTAATNQASRDIANANINEELNFAQNGISWRIADAAKNGISPLAALGAAEPGFSPVSAVFNDPPVATPSYSSPISSVSASVDSMGQNISRALGAQASATQKASDALDLAFKSKQNDLLDLQIRGAALTLARQSSPPGIPWAYTSMSNADGSTSVVPSAEAAQAAHGQFLGPILWSLDNKLIPAAQSYGSAVGGTIRQGLEDFGVTSN